MNKKHLLAMLLVLLITGCVKEDWSDCNNVTINFRYPDAGSSPFTDHIEKVNLSIFRQDGSFVASHQFNKSDLTQFAGTELKLDAGVYRIVCWGNILDYTRLGSPNASVSDATLTHSNATSNNGDPLFYGPKLSNIDNPESFTITVPSSGQITETIDFGAAHNILEIAVKGFSDDVSGTATILPIVEVSNLSDGYNFSMQPLSGTVAYSRRAEAATISGDQVGFASFTIPQFKNDNPIIIRVKNPSDGNESYILNLKDFLNKYSISVSPIALNTVRVNIEFVNTDVEVTLPSWNSSDVHPAF